MKGTVTNYLQATIAKQVDEHGIVVWYDPEAHYAQVVPTLTIPDTTIFVYEDSFFALRHAFEPLLSRLERPRFIVYVPLDPNQTEYALLEVEQAGVIIAPGRQPPTRNTRLTVVARNALKDVLSSDNITAIEKQIDAGQLTLADIETLAAKGQSLSSGVVSLIFGTAHPQDVALLFLSTDRYDPDITTKGAGAELATLLHTAFAITLPDDETPESHRRRLARHILATDLHATLQDAMPDTLAEVSTATPPAARDACVALARAWRMRVDLQASYVAHARQVGQELGLSSLALPLPSIVAVETFQEIEDLLQHQVEAALLSQATAPMLQLAHTRQSSFWAEQVGDIQARWALIATAGQVLREADRIEHELPARQSDAGAILQAYTTAEAPWCLLDTAHRTMEWRYHTFEFATDEQHAQLEQLVVKARQRYATVGAMLSETFLRCYQQAHFQLPNILRQRDIFEQVVRPVLVQGKTAYLWVDALRYEMAHSLVQEPDQGSTVNLVPALATVPTITEIGMAALLPQSHTATLDTAGPGKLALTIAGTQIKDRKDRIAFLKQHIDASVFDAKLSDLLPRLKKKIRDGIAQADLILITSQEIDRLGEGDDAHVAHRTMGDILHELRRVVRILTELHVQTIIIAADHGYLMGDELDESMKIDPPGGDTADLHRRAWVGQGGAAHDSYMRATLADFGLESTLEIAVPWGLGGFRVKGGATSYFHGGMSLQELVIPVLTVTATAGPRPSSSPVAWSLSTSSEKISTRFFSVQVAGMATGLFDLEPPRVRVEIRVQKQRISTQVSASYGFEDATNDVLLACSDSDPRTIEPNTITLMITDPPAQKTTASIHLLDATSGVELARQDHIEVTILAY